MVEFFHSLYIDLKFKAICLEVGSLDLELDCLGLH